MDKSAESVLSANPRFESSVARRVLVSGFALAAAGLLSACGFEPLYGQSAGRAATVELSEIAIPAIPDRIGQLLRNALVDRFAVPGPTRRSRYSLAVRITEPRQALALRRDDVISRYSYSASAAFTLIDEKGAKIYSGSSSFTTDYELTSSEYATLSSREDARARLVELIADDMRSQLALFLTDPKRPK